MPRFSLLPMAERRLRQVQLARHGPHGPTFVEDQPNGPGFELIRELSSCSSASLA
jgi:hypothetical protein